MVVVLLVDVGFGDLHSTKDPAMDLYIIQMSKLILQSAAVLLIMLVIETFSNFFMHGKSLLMQNIVDTKRDFKIKCKIFLIYCLGTY